MQEILFDYRLNPTTWAYISSLMIVGIYFKFSRFWSVRNLDLVLLLSFTPGLLLIYYGLLKDLSELERAGYTWMFVAGALFLVRLLFDSLMVRRPLLEPNLSAGGLTFTGLALLVFLMANVITVPQERLECMLTRQGDIASPAPGHRPFHDFSEQVRQAAVLPTPQPGLAQPRHEIPLPVALGRVSAIAAHLAVLAGIVWIGLRHFDNIHNGVAGATLYLLCFYTSQLTGQLDHVIPAALLTWAVALYRLPFFAGLLLGIAGGLSYYPLFLLPLWCGFYWRRGVIRFILGLLLALFLALGSLLLVCSTTAEFLEEIQHMFGFRNPLVAKLSGFWRFYDPVFRIPILVSFIVLSVSLAIWPAQKNLGTLLSCSAALMLAAQFWHAQQGGLQMAWFLPLLILTIFRPNLEDRVAFTTVRPAWRAGR